MFTSDNGNDALGQLALVGGKMDSDRRRHPCALDCPLARRDYARQREHANLHDHGLERHDARRAAGATATASHPLDGPLADARCCATPPGATAAVLAHEPPGPARHAPSAWKYPARGRATTSSTRRRRTRTRQQPYCPRATGGHGAGVGAWEATMPPIPTDTVSLGYGVKDMPQR